MKNILISCLCYLGLLYPGTILGQPGKFKSLEMRAEMQTYYSENIEPVLKAQRAKLEELITTDDQEQIDEIRSNAQALKSEFKTLKKEIKVNRQNQEPLSEDQRQALQAFRQSKQEQASLLKPIAQKYLESIQSLMNEISDSKEKWKADIKAIRQKYITDEPKERPDFDRRYQLKSKFRRHFIARFLLMEPEFVLDQVTVNASRIFPNPGTIQQQLVYEVEQPGQVRIELLDEQGKIIKQLVQEIQSKGEHQIQLNTQDLDKGVYFYRIEQSGKQEIKRVLIQK